MSPAVYVCIREAKFSDWFSVRPTRKKINEWRHSQWQISWTNLVCRSSTVTSWLCRSENATTTSTLCSLARSVKVSTLPLAQLAAVTQNLFMSRDYSCPKMGGTLFSSWPMLLMLLLQTMMTNDDAHKVNIKAGSIDLENTFQQLTKGSLQNSNMVFFGKSSQPPLTPTPPVEVGNFVNLATFWIFFEKYRV